MGSRVSYAEVDPQIAVSNPVLKYSTRDWRQEDPARLVFKQYRDALVAAVSIWADGSVRVNRIHVQEPRKISRNSGRTGSVEDGTGSSDSCRSVDTRPGGHHTAFSNIVTDEMLRDWSEMVGIECTVIDKNTVIPAFRNELRWNAAYWGGKK